MKLLRLSLLSVLLSTTASTAYAAGLVHGWSQNWGDASAQYGRDAVVDGSGNIIVIGEFSGTIDVGGGPMISAGGNDLFVAKFDAEGNHLWSQQFGDASNQTAKSVAVDGSNNIVVTGYFQGAVNFSGVPLVSAGSDDIFLVKFDTNGNHLWSKAFGDVNVQYGNEVAVDAAGNVVLVGTIGGSTNFGGGVLTLAGALDAVLVKFDPGGSHLWSQNFGDGNNQRGEGVAVDGSDNIVMAGYFVSTIDFGGGVLTSVVLSNDVYAAKFDGAGTHLWSDSYGDANTDICHDVALDSADNVFLNGFFQGGIDFGGGFFVSAGDYDIFLAKLDSGGSHLWSQKFGDSSAQYAEDVVVDGSDHVIVVASYFGTVDFGGGGLLAVGGRDVGVAKFDASGNHTWSARYGDAPHDYPVSVTTDASGNVIVPGFFAGAIDFGGGLLTSAGSWDAFVVKFWRTQEIQLVQDVPGDQGGVVNVAWDGFGADTPAEHAITEYTLWRGISLAGFTAMVEGGATVSVVPPASAEIRAGAPYVRVEETAQTTFYWQLMKTVQAFYLPAYFDQVPTQFDSTSVSTQYSYFQVIAHTSDPFTFYVSDPDSGYSVDNLPPALVTNLLGEQIEGPGGLTMTWDPNSEVDLDHYVIYRGTDPGFVPGTGNLLGTTTLPTIDDGGWTWDSGFYYKVAAVDENENEGEPALLGPGLVTGIAPLAIPNRNYLDHNIPNPFNPSTTIRYGLKETGNVTLRIYDASGQLVRTLVDEVQRAAPEHIILWDGRNDAGQPASSGVYFYRLVTSGFAETKKLVILK